MAQVLTNARHELFAQEIAKGKNASEAYGLAGYKGSPQAMRSSASTLRTNPNIAARVAELQRRGAIRAEMTIASAVEEYEVARLIAKDAIQPSAMIAATTAKAKILGLMPEQQTANNHLTINEAPLSDLELARRLAFALAKAAHIKQQLEAMPPVKVD